jgi:4-amino-4-deoxy-L-arabinose transferase-like glycosyltransferase
MASRPVTRPLVTCVLLALAVRAPFVSGSLGSDEAGLLMVVRGWGPGPDRLYGDYWVDRPPLLLGSFWLADQLGPYGVRLVGCLAAVLLVAAAVAVGRLVAGRAGSWSAGLVAASLGSSYLTVGHMANGMVQGAALSMLSCACTLMAVRGERGPLVGWCFAAGVLGAAALLVKQSFVCGLVFGGVVLAVAAWSRPSRRPFGLGLVAGAAGALSCGAGVLGWAVAQDVDLDDLAEAVFAFRLQASAVIADATSDAPVRRTPSLLWTIIGCGAGLIAGALLWRAPSLWRARPDVRPEAAGALALLLVGGAAIAFGGSVWRHYVLQLVAGATVGAALLTLSWSGRRSRARVVVGATVVSAVASTVVGVAVERTPTEQLEVGRALGEAARPGDTAVVLWGHAEVLLEADAQSPYPHLWSLPIRTLDPELSLLLSTLEGPDAPTWVVRWNSFTAFGLDEEGRLKRVVERRYREVADPCGREMYLLRGVTRSVPDRDPCG